MRCGIAWLVVACSGGDDGSTLSPFSLGGSSETTETGDTGDQEDAPPEVMEFSVGGWFGYDATTATVVPVLDDGEEVPSYFYLEFRSTEYNGSCSDEVCCYVFIETDGTTGEQFAVDDGYAFGFHVPQTVAEGYSTCIENGFDPDDAAWGGGDPFEVWSDASHGWGVTLGGLPSATVTDWTGDGNPYGLVIGGQFLSADLDSEDTLYFNAWSADASMAVDFDAPLDAISIQDTDGNLVSGYYSYDVMVHFDPEP